MYQFSGILLHMDLMDPDRLFASGCLDLDAAIPADRQIQLGDLIVLWIIRVKIILPVKFAVLGDRTVCCQSHCDRVFHNLFV